MQGDLGTYPRWVADIGGTNARFAWVDTPVAPLSDEAIYACADHATLTDAMRHYLSAHGKSVPPWCAIGIATPVTGDSVRMTNHHWAFSIENVRRAIGLARLVVVNDFTALALSIDSLRPEELRQVGSGSPAVGASKAVIGPGTGLGVSGLIPVPDSGRYAPISGEGGHVSLAGGDDFEDRVVAQLRRRFGHASAERVLSGPGLVNLYAAICSIEGVEAEQLSAADVAQRGQGGDAADPAARALDLFFAWLGSVAGNLALTLGARGGVYIGGGIVTRLGLAIDRSRFRERFVDKGRYRDYLSAVPTYVIEATGSPALRGALRALD